RNIVLSRMESKFPCWCIGVDNNVLVLVRQPLLQVHVDVGHIEAFPLFQCSGLVAGVLLILGRDRDRLHGALAVAVSFTARVPIVQVVAGRDLDLLPHLILPGQKVDAFTLLIKETYLIGYRPLLLGWGQRCPLGW